MLHLSSFILCVEGLIVSDGYPNREELPDINPSITSEVTSLSTVSCGMALKN